MDLLGALQEWFALACNGDWEHTYGVKIETLDNPGWSLRIDLCDTPLEYREFHSVSFQRTECDWVVCRIENNGFVGFGGAGNLEEIIQIFMNWWNADGTRVSGTDNSSN